MLIRLRTIIHGESGQSLVLVALILAGLLGFGALVTDVGYAYYQKSYLQNAADSAALAGALEAAGNTVDSSVYAVVDQYITSNLQAKEALSTKERTLDRAQQTVNVKINQNIPKFLAGILTSTNHLLSVQATARYDGFWGQALPFFNINQSYSIGNTLYIWSKQNPGEFGRIHNDDITVINGGTSDVYFSVNYKDGFIEDKEGVDANIEKDVDTLLSNGGYAYIFSIRADKVAEYTGKNDLKNKQQIPITDMVLLKVQIGTYSFKDSPVTVVAVYNWNASNSNFSVPLTSNLIQ